VVPSVQLAEPNVRRGAAQPGAPGWNLADGLPTRERDLVTASFEEVGDLVGAGWEVSE
jgi:hypothetical protein